MAKFIVTQGEDSQYYVDGKRIRIKQYFGEEYPYRVDGVPFYRHPDLWILIYVDIKIVKNFWGFLKERKVELSINKSMLEICEKYIYARQGQTWSRMMKIKEEIYRWEDRGIYLRPYNCPDEAA